MSPLLLALLLAGPPGPVAGVVFDDADGDGRRGASEPGLAGVLVSDGASVVATDGDGSYRIESAAARHVFVVTPGDRRASGGWYAARAERVDFALAPSPAPAAWRFAHLSDTHVDEGNRERMRRALALAQERRAELGIVTGDLVRDALRVDEATARSVYSLYATEAGRGPLPLHSMPGNHEIFGIERQHSLVPKTHPAYGKAMYEEYLGPRYHAFWRGGVLFLALDTLSFEDLEYYGLIEEGQLAWLRALLRHVPAGASVVTAGHVPLRSGRLSTEYSTDPPAPTLLSVKGVSWYRHLVRNRTALEDVLKPLRWTLALQGHTHTGERLRIWDGGITRYNTAPAVDWRPGVTWVSGIVVYTVRGDVIDDGEDVPLDRP